MNSLADNPFAALTFIAAPALLTNSAALLLLSTSNRFARVTDRVRALARQLEEALADDIAPLRLRQLDIAERRIFMLVRALTAFYAAAGSFAGGTLIALVGATLIAIEQPQFALGTLHATLVVGLLGFGGLMIGAAMLVWETRLAAAMLREEMRYARGHLRSIKAAASR